MTTAPELLSADTRRRTVAAWANAIGASQQDLSRSGWIFVEREDFDSVVVVYIDQIGLAAAPRRVLDVIRAASRRTLLDADALARLLPRGSDPIGSADLLFAERIPPASAIAAVIAIAGYQQWSSALAQLGVVAAQQHRGGGFAYAAAAAATGAALAEGLIPQWRSRQGNNSSTRLAQRLGFAHLGIQSAVRLPLT